MGKPNKSLKELMINILSEEVVIIRNKLDKIALSGGSYGKEVILINSITEHAYIMSAIVKIHSISERFNILYDVTKKADTMYTIKSNISKMNRCNSINLNLLLQSNNYIDLDECFNLYNTIGTFANNPVLMPFAEIIAEVQQRADLIFYSDNPTKDFNNEASGNTLNEIVPICRIIEKLGIAELVYAEALKIYDFRNSGRSGYTLKDKIIQKIE